MNENYRSLSFEEVCATLLAPKPTLILFHRNPDGDAVGSAFALKRILSSLGSPAWCVAPDEVPSRLRFLADSEQKSVLPTSIPASFNGARVISVDVASPSQLGDLRERFGGKVDLMIDHHGNGVPFADHYILPSAAASGEILYSFARRLRADGKLADDRTVNERLYGAISSDTGCFRFSNATPPTHRIAAELIESGIDAAEINHLLFESNSLDQVRAEGAAISNLGFAADGKIGYVLFPYSLKASLGVAEEHLENLIEIPRSIEGVRVAFSVRQPSPDGIFRVSMRAACDYDVSALCAKFGGGGHKRAAGCTIEAESMESVVKAVLDAIDPTQIP